MPEDYRATVSQAAQYHGSQPASAPSMRNGAAQPLPSALVLDNQEKMLALLDERLGVLLQRLEDSVLRPPFPPVPEGRSGTEPGEAMSNMLGRMNSMTHVLACFLARVDDAIARLEV